LLARLIQQRFRHRQSNTLMQKFFRSLLKRTPRLEARSQRQRACHEQQRRGTSSDSVQCLRTMIARQ
jgi:hypothetical protein